MYGCHGSRTGCSNIAAHYHVGWVYCLSSLTYHFSILLLSSVGMMVRCQIGRAMTLVFYRAAKVTFTFFPHFSHTHLFQIWNRRLSTPLTSFAGQSHVY